MADGPIVILDRRGNAALVGGGDAVQVVNPDGRRAVDTCAFSRAGLDVSRGPGCRSNALVSKGERDGSRF